jgi:hypothetical protein
MAVLTPQPKMQFTTAAGVPLSGGKVYTYIAGTTTPQATFTDYSGATPNTNPVILDSRGEANIWLGGALYKFKLTDANDVEIWTVDYISAPTSAVSPVLSGNVTIDSDTPGPALKITQTGTGPVLRVQDSADPDATPFIIDNAGNVGIGTPTPTAQLEATGAAKIGSLTLTSAPLPVASGGTGLATLTANNVLIGAGTSSVTFVAPGASGNVLVSNGTSWTSGALAAFQLREQLFLAGGTWTAPAGVTRVQLVIIAGGGGGGGYNIGGANDGGVGGVGGVAVGSAIVVPGTAYTVTVGAGGAGGATNANGAAGGTSSFGALMSATGGGGGLTNGSAGAAGAGTNGTTRNTNIGVTTMAPFGGILTARAPGSGAAAVAWTISSASAAGVAGNGATGTVTAQLSAGGVGGAVYVQWVA